MSRCLNDIDIEQYLNGVLTKRPMQRIEAHLADCSDCLGRLERARADDAFLLRLREAYQQQLPDDVSTRLQRRSFEALQHQGSSRLRRRDPEEQGKD